MPPYKRSLVTCIERDITAEPAISSGFYSVQASAALRDSWKLGRTLQYIHFCSNSRRSSALGTQTDVQAM